MKMGEKYADLLDMVYPYVTRTVQGMLTQWTSTVDLCVWQIAVIVFAVVVLTALVLVVIFKKNVLQWLGWVLAVVSIVAFLHTGIYGLNYYNGDIADDLRMEIADYTQTELEAATEYYRDMANGLATQLPRNEQGAVKFSSFEDLSKKTGAGFRKLVLDRSFSIFGGDYTPVKKLGWADMYSSMGITGFTCFLTGEAAVNPRSRPSLCPLPWPTRWPTGSAWPGRMTPISRPIWPAKRPPAGNTGIPAISWLTSIATMPCTGWIPSLPSGSPPAAVWN